LHKCARTVEQKKAVLLWCPRRGVRSSPPLKEPPPPPPPPPRWPRAFAFLSTRTHTHTKKQRRSPTFTHTPLLPPALGPHRLAALRFLAVGHAPVPSLISSLSLSPPFPLVAPHAQLLGLARAHLVRLDDVGDGRDAFCCCFCGVCAYVCVCVVGWSGCGSFVCVGVVCVCACARAQRSVFLLGEFGDQGWVGPAICHRLRMYLLQRAPSVRGAAR
jgi:hypothetical protein